MHIQYDTRLSTGSRLHHPTHGFHSFQQWKKVIAGDPIFFTRECRGYVLSPTSLDGSCWWNSWFSDHFDHSITILLAWKFKHHFLMVGFHIFSWSNHAEFSSNIRSTPPDLLFFDFVNLLYVRDMTGMVFVRPQEKVFGNFKGEVDT